MLDYKIKKTDGDTSWFIKDRFGLFIHFGLYSSLARHEWIKTTEQIEEEKYDSYMDYFDPDLFNANEWAKKAKDAGMKYAVLTAKHHEGFCMFDSKYTDYKITNTPFKRDLVKEYVEAFRKAGLKVGIYYSLIDWHHKDFTIDLLHPRRDDGEDLDKNRDMKKYNEYMRNQVRELLTNYGKIDIIWFDFVYPNPDTKQIFAFDKLHPTPNPNKRAWMRGDGGKNKDDFESDKLISLVRSINKDIIINDRTGLPGDIKTPEQIMPTEPLKDKDTGEYLVWEACHTFSGSWGYYRDEMSWKSPKMLIEMLVKTVSTGGNFIINVGPTARGGFDHRANNALDVYKDFMKYNSRSIYGSTYTNEFIGPNGTVISKNRELNRIYINMFEIPYKVLHVKNLGPYIKYAQILRDASELTYTINGDDVIFDIPATLKNDIDIVIEVFLK